MCLTYIYIYMERERERFGILVEDAGHPGRGRDELLVDLAQRSEVPLHLGAHLIMHVCVCEYVCMCMYIEI